MKLRLYVSSVLALAILLVPRLWAQDIEADAVLRAREAGLAAGDLHAGLSLFADEAAVVTASGRLVIGKRADPRVGRGPNKSSYTTFIPESARRLEAARKKN
jgi:hypothetical protein